MRKLIIICVAIFFPSCMTWRNRGAVAENVGFIALTPDISNPIHIGTRQEQACDWNLIEPFDDRGPDQQAFAAFISKLKSEGIRYVTQIKSVHEDQTIFIPLLGGTSNCIIFSGEAYK